jgi:hypothetical protein
VLKWSTGKTPPSNSKKQAAVTVANVVSRFPAGGWGGCPASCTGPSCSRSPPSTVYGACQGVGNAIGGVAAGYYWKDVQRVQPSVAQFYQGVTDAPWIVKPIWGLLTDVVPVAGFRRRPYFVLAGQISYLSWFQQIAS